MKAWFVSDIHIADSNDPRLVRFENFLRARLEDQTTHLFLVGDIFDLWVGGDKFFARRYVGVLELIRNLRSRGVEVIYFEGNHDLHLHKVWQDELGAQVEVGPKYFDLGKFRVRVEHGDQMNPADKGYLFLRALLRTSTIEKLADVLPGRVIQAIGNRMSRSSRKWTSSSLNTGTRAEGMRRNEDAIRAMIHAHAEKVYRDDEPFDFLISGHVHVQDDFKWTDSSSSSIREVRSINLGTWLADKPARAFCLEETGRWVDV